MLSDVIVLFDKLKTIFGVYQNIDFCSAFCQKLYIEDFYCTLSSFDFLSPEDGLPLDIVYQYLLPYKAGTQFDIILAWDLFNYLDELEFRELMVHLGRFCRPNTLLFAFISTCKSIPERPAKYSIVDTETITSQKLSNIIRPCPQYQETQLNKLMPEYQVLNSFLLRNGFKEYLFSSIETAYAVLRSIDFTLTCSILIMFCSSNSGIGGNSSAGNPLTFVENDPDSREHKFPTTSISTLFPSTSLAML
mgnify:CR=1 FL=1